MKEIITQDYMRDSSGLIKEFNKYDVFIFNVLGFSLGVVLSVAPTFLGSNFPNASPYLVLILGTALAILNGYVYSLFSSAMPRSGGEYEYVGRTFNHKWGFVANWGFSWSQFLGLGVYTAWCIQTALVPALLNFGYATNNDAFIGIGRNLAEPINTFIIGLVILVMVYIVSVSGLKSLKRLLNTFFVIALVGTLITIAIFLSTSNSEFIKIFDQFMIEKANYPNAYTSIIELAKSEGLGINHPTSILDSILALPIGYWLFIGFTYSVYVGGEVKKADKSQNFGIIGSLIFGFLIYLIAFVAYYNTVGIDFNNAISIIQGSDKSPLLVDGSIGSLAGIITKSVFLNIFVGFSNFLWYILLLFVMAQVCSRNLFAWSHYRVMPKSLAKVSEKTGAPTISILIITIMAILFLSLYLFADLAFINYIAIFSVAFLIAGIAAIKFASPHNRVFQISPMNVKRKVLGVYFMKIAGVGNTILFLLLLYSSLTNAGIGGAEGILPIFILIIIYISGFIVYYISKKINSKKYIDLDKEMYLELSED